MDPSHNKRRRRESDEGASQRVFPFGSPWSLPVPAWSEHTSTQWQPDHGPVPMVGVPDSRVEWNLKPVSWVCYGMVRLIFVAHLYLNPSRIFKSTLLPNLPVQQVTKFYGTYTRIPADIGSGNRNEESDSFAVTILSNHEFTPQSDSPISACGKFHPDFFDIVQALLDESGLRLQAGCTVNNVQPQGSQAKAARLGPVSLPCEVSITLYGPTDLMDNVGEFFQTLDMYLQDPKGCDWDVKYCNPHRLSSINLSDCPMTSDLSRPSTEVDQTLFQQIVGESDILEVFDVQQDLPEATQPELILPSLKK